MLDSTLPDHIKLVKFCKKNAQFNGSWSLAAFKRLTETALTTDGNVSVEVLFSYQHGFPAIVGKAYSQVEMQCQRCLSPVMVPLNVDIALGFVTAEEQLENVPETLEGVIYEPEQISMIEIVEQELILALPLIPYHSDCSAYQYQIDAPPEPQPEERENPFKVLQALKNKESD